jgi:hypothetical protein
MGQNQLLLIMAGVLLAGLAIYVALTMFGASAEDSTRKAMINDLTAFANSARVWYGQSVAQGGGGGAFDGLSPGRIGMTDNANARYFIESASGDLCLITGMGKIVASNNDSVKVRVRITPQRNQIEILN